MAKNDKKNNVKPLDDEKRDTISAPEKVAELPAAEARKEEKKAADNLNKLAEPVAAGGKKTHGWRKFMLFILLLILVGGGAAVMHWRQLETQNAATLQNLQKTWENKVTALEIRLKEVEKDVSGLKNRPVVEQVAGVSENQVNQKLAVLRDELLQRLNSNNTNGEDATVASETETPDVSVSEKALLAPEIASLAAQERKTQEVLLASGAIIVRDLAEQGLPFAYEAEVLQILARGNELAENYAQTVRKFSNSGIRSKNQLIHDFQKIFTDLNSTELKNQPTEEKLADDAKWIDKAIYWIKRAFVARKIPERPVFMPQNDEVLNLVNDGRLSDALNALKTSEKYSKLNSLPLNEWRVQVEKYLEFNAAAGGLIMNALANIRLKEMEHSVQ